MVRIAVIPKSVAKKPYAHGSESISAPNLTETCHQEHLGASSQTHQNVKEIMKTMPSQFAIGPSLLAAVIAFVQPAFGAGVDVMGERLNIGVNHLLSGNQTTIAGGRVNTNISNFYGVISGGFSNLLAFTATNSVIAGGSGNTVTGSWNTVGGGLENLIAYYGFNTIGGGAANTITGWSSTISGGQYNYNGVNNGTIGGGHLNKIHQYFAFNMDFGENSTIGGGEANELQGHAGVIGGGDGNNLLGIGSTIAGGSGNSVVGDDSTIGGGFGNQISVLRYTNTGPIFGGVTV